MFIPTKMSKLWYLDIIQGVRIKLYSEMWLHPTTPGDLGLNKLDTSLPQDACYVLINSSVKYITFLVERLTF